MTGKLLPEKEFGIVPLEHVNVIVYRLYLSKAILCVCFKLYLILGTALIIRKCCWINLWNYPHYTLYLLVLALLLRQLRFKSSSSSTWLWIQAYPGLNPFTIKWPTANDLALNFNFWIHRKWKYFICRICEDWKAPNYLEHFKMLMNNAFLPFPINGECKSSLQSSPF